MFLERFHLMVILVMMEVMNFLEVVAEQLLAVVVLVVQLALQQILFLDR